LDRSSLKLKRASDLKVYLVLAFESNFGFVDINGVTSFLPAHLF
jgi:hypothetical protein